MKTIYKITFLLMFAALSAAAQSQNQQRFPQLQERILHAKLQEIRRSLNLDQATFERFRPIYVQYEKEIAGVNLRGQERLMRSDYDSLTTEEAERMVLLRMQNAKKLLDIREKYYFKFKTVLTPQQIVKLYQTEAEIRRKVMLEVHRRFGTRIN